jgi:hypothetical protein
MGQPIVQPQTSPSGIVGQFVPVDTPPSTFHFTPLFCAMPVNAARLEDGPPIHVPVIVNDVGEGLEVMVRLTLELFTDDERSEATMKVPSSGHDMSYPRTTPARRRGVSIEDDTASCVINTSIFNLNCIF